MRGQAQAPDFAAQWGSTAWREVPTPRGLVRARVYERYVQAASVAFPVATLTYLSLPKNGPTESPDAAAEQLRQGMGFTSWHKRRQGQAWVYESPWKKNGRFMRLYILDQKDRFSVSTAVFRVAYGENLALESELLQRGLLGVLTAPAAAPWLERLLTSLEASVGLHEAWAACPPCTSTNFVSCVSCTDREVGSGLSSINSTLGGINSGLGEANATGAAATRSGTAAANKANDTATKATNNATSAANVANNHAADAVTSANRIGDDANQNWAETNRQASRANDTLSQLTDPKNAFILGAAAAGGAVLGSAAVNLALEGLSAGMGVLVESVTHEKETARRLAAFTAAREKIENLRAPVADLEKSIDNSLYLAGLARKFGTRERLIAVVGADYRRNDRNLDRLVALQKTAEDAELDGGCVAELNLEVAKVERVSQNMQSLMKIINAEDYGTLCDKMKNDIRMLIRAEDELRHARLKLYNGYGAYVADKTAEEISDAKELADGKKRMAETRDLEIARAAAKRDAKLKEIRDGYDRTWRGCVSRRSPVWSSIPLVGGVVTADDRAACRTEAARTDSGDGTGRTYLQRKKEAEDTYVEMAARARTNFETSTEIAPKMALDGGIGELHQKDVQAWIEELNPKQTAQSLQNRTELLQMRQSDINAACADRW